MKILFYALFAIILSSCMTSQEVEQRSLNQANGKCQRYGFKPNTNAFASCVQKEMNSSYSYGAGQNPMEAYNSSLCTTGYKEYCK